MRRKSLIVILVLAGLICGAFLLGFLGYLIGTPSEPRHLFSGGEVGLVVIEGGIFDPRDTVEELDKYRKDNDIQAMVVRIESPGGAVAASQEIFDAIKRLAQKKPTVASLGSVAASGGYYVACGATKIVANPASITGSIGVRMDHLNVGALLQWAKIGHETLKSGRFKDIASPDRPIGPEEKVILEDMLVDLHRQFKETVKQARRFDDQKIAKVSDGRIYTGEEAKQLGLVDELGGQFEAVKLAGELANIKGEPEVVEKYKPRHKWVTRLFESAIREIKFLSLENDRTFKEPMFLYWSY